MSNKILSHSNEWIELKDSPRPKVDPSLYKSGYDEDNKTKNRYSDILPLEKTRVHLKMSSEGNDKKDYINANYIDIGNDKKVIACQAPVPGYFDDFWNMVLQHESPFILMLTNFIEKYRVKAHIYWPSKPGLKAVMGNISLINFGTSTLGECEVTKILIEKKDKTHITYHIRYTGWPDFGVPSNYDDILFLVNKIIPKYSGSGIPIMHCSAGCGRTGVICSILRKINTNEKIPKIVFNLRTCRQGMVQTKTQYKYIYGIIDCIEKSCA